MEFRKSPCSFENSVRFDERTREEEGDRVRESLSKIKSSHRILEGYPTVSETGSPPKSDSENHREECKIHNAPNVPTYFRG